MKKFVLFLSLMASCGAAAVECVDSNGKDILGDPDLIAEVMKQTSSCTEAASFARACMWGASMDVGITRGAQEICGAELKSYKPSKQLIQLLNGMRAACDRKYRKQTGTLYVSLHAHCHLSAIEWIVGAAAPVN